MLNDYQLGQTSLVLRFKLRDSSVTTGAGLTGLTSASSGLIISTLADNEATATAYAVASSKVESITTLGTYAAPTATKCRFKEVDGTNHPGIYEFQFADARLAVSGAKSMIISVSGATNLVQTDVLIPLRSVNPYDAVRFGLSAILDAAIGATVVDTTPAAGSFKGDTTLSATDAFYVNSILVFTGGALKGIARKVTGYTGSTRLLSFATAFPAAPANGDPFDILGLGG